MLWLPREEEEEVESSCILPRSFSGTRRDEGGGRRRQEHRRRSTDRLCRGAAPAGMARVAGRSSPCSSSSSRDGLGTSKRKRQPRSCRRRQRLQRDRSQRRRRSRAEELGDRPRRLGRPHPPPPLRRRRRGSRRASRTLWTADGEGEALAAETIPAKTMVHRRRRSRRTGRWYVECTFGTSRWKRGRWPTWR
jgi:hypothetical protein